MCKGRKGWEESRHPHQAVQEDGKIIFSVKNPVVEKVQITDGIVLDSNGGMHGIGLSNVKAVVDKYGGDFVISCDSEKFQAVVML